MLPLVTNLSALGNLRYGNAVAVIILVAFVIWGIYLLRHGK